jgi:hypothetical protein
MNLFDAMHRGGAAGRHATREMKKIQGEVLEKAGIKLPVPAPEVCGSRSTKRRSKRDIEIIEDAIYEALLEDKPMTVRQVFYRLVSNGVIGKTEGEYKNAVVRLLRLMRLRGDVPFDWIADNTRWMRKPRTWSSLESMLAHIGSLPPRRLGQSGCLR